MNRAQLCEVLRRPIISEKSTRANETQQVVFEVQTHATKSQIRRAVEHLFEVGVVGVQVVSVPGKARRFGRQAGKRRDWKKAYVRLREGDSIDFFEGAQQG